MSDLREMATEFGQCLRETGEGIRTSDANTAGEPRQALDPAFRELDTAAASFQFGLAFSRIYAKWIAGERLSSIDR